VDRYKGQAAVFITVDHCSTECVGIHASRSADRFQALEPVKQAVRQCHGLSLRPVGTFEPMRR
jgi:putative transposase